jgi:hypothetical protein
LFQDRFVSLTEWFRGYQHRRRARTSPWWGAGTGQAGLPDDDGPARAAPAAGL